MNITHARFVTLPVSGRERAKDFYVTAPGFQVIADRQLGPVRWLRVGPAGAQVEGPVDLPWGRQATLGDPGGNGFVLAAPVPAGF
ncbi:glyoxalase [Planobispora siamensis]|uniref:Glyoxalase n=1 Tax=Planobispora siamensis TaxID=936338 RepID=A0A8J3WMG1_9ACTN|nr:glyoxalase [Planobispora siamensis]GIH92836.1 hypothetical protein Psi01_34660 [Planobispora siamensis]